MCGVFGFSQINEAVRRMAPFVAYEMEQRGGDSWGGSDGQQVMKMIGTIGRSFNIPEHWKRAIFHTRAATVGEVSQRNAHPFEVVVDGRRVVGVHNGHVSNYSELNNKYRRNAQVDSEHIFIHLAEQKNLDELTGRGTVAWFDGQIDETGQQVIHLTRWNYGDLEIAKLENGTVVFASTKYAIKKAALWGRVEIDGFYKDCVDGLKYDVKTVGQKDEIFKLENMGFNTGHVSYVSNNHDSWNGRYWDRHKWNSYGTPYAVSAVSTHKTLNKTCLNCTKDARHCLCEECLDKFEKDWKKERSNVSDGVVDIASFVKV